MGFLGDDGEDEVEIKASTQVDSTSDEETELMNEVESKFGSDSSGSSSSKDSDVSLEEVHRQNEKIISMLEDLTGSKNSDGEDDFSTGDGLDGVL